ncbi:hypothetical protein GCM10007973_23990 [Polymorphobacter multimanifer]|uniref:Uncharacterized protein n=1 Tax=Polymorphobacter multimanifer TaxID=1070431 RepID=A0A841LJ85_9SPHN|nr:hypothetical protein [Polymorphobacter multimanifer]MBB6229282.1 hypothetical protein [Polymorphobacter multimanifer]GGI86758.1 hypothetical protein GCM10007973_23990 [Polymorphobacter multimanifer]
MTDEVAKDELQALRDRVAELEAARDKPVKVEVEGLEGIRQLSHAIETQQLDRFALQNSVPDKVFWGWFWGFVIACGLLLLVGFLRSV